MSRKEELQMMTTALVAAHKGRAYFSLGEASKIVGCGRENMSHKLHRAGVTIQKIGNSKRVSAYDLAAAMCEGRIAPIDDTSKGV